MKTTKHKTIEIMALAIGILIRTATASAFIDSWTTNTFCAASSPTKSYTRTTVAHSLQCAIVKGTNLVWCNTLQLAWRKLCLVAGDKVGLYPPVPLLTEITNNTISLNDIDNDSVVVEAGIVGSGILETLQKELALRSKENVDATWFANLSPGDVVVYSYLSKCLPFRWSFSRFHALSVFAGTPVESFGIEEFLDEQRNEVQMATQVSILDYADESNIVVELKTSCHEDVLILAMIPPEKSLGNTISSVYQRISCGKASTIRETESLCVPVIDIDILRRYAELENKQIIGSTGLFAGATIGIAVQTTRFHLDERGTRVESRTVFASGLPSRKLIFDKPFLVILSRRHAKNPYFVLWIDNTEVLVPCTGESGVMKPVPGMEQ